MSAANALAAGLTAREASHSALFGLLEHLNSHYRIWTNV
jgi:hypothetical protein